MILYRSFILLINLICKQEFYDAFKLKNTVFKTVKEGGSEVVMYDLSQCSPK